MKKKSSHPSNNNGFFFNNNGKIFKQIIEQNSEGIILFDRSGKLEYYNPSIKQLIDNAVNYSATNTSSSNHYEHIKHINDLLPNIKLSVDGTQISLTQKTIHIENAIGKILESEFKVNKIKNENRNLSENNDIPNDIPVEITVNQIDYNKQLFYSVVVRNISTKKFAEKLIHDQEVMLVQSSRQEPLRRMAGGIAHEINNPLTIALGHLSYVKNKITKITNNTLTLDNDVCKNLNDTISKLDGALIRVNRIVKNLVAFSYGEDTEKFVKIKLKEILEKTISLFHESFKRDNIHVQLECLDTIEINCKQAQLSQAFFNIFSNSYDALKESNTQSKLIEVTIENEDQNINIRFKDNGPGIADDLIHKIFEPFFTTKPVGTGTGLGLSFAKSVIEQHKGEIDCEIKKNPTSFLIRLPRLTE